MDRTTDLLGSTAKIHLLWIQSDQSFSRDGLPPLFWLMAANTCSRHTFFLGRRKWLHMYMPKQRALNLDRWRDSLSRIVPDPSMLKQHFFSSLVNSPRVRSMAAYIVCRSMRSFQSLLSLSLAAMPVLRVLIRQLVPPSHHGQEAVQLSASSIKILRFFGKSPAPMRDHNVFSWHK